MLLTRDAILAAIASGTIKIDPYEPNHVGAASVDICLGRFFRRFKHINQIYTVTSDANFEDLTEEFTIQEDETFLVKPGETILGITLERVTLAPNIAAWIEGRSKMARIGLGVHISSGFVQPGVANHQVLEITNLGPTPLDLQPGIRICQLVFERCEGEAAYTGQFATQNKP